MIEIILAELRRQQNKADADNNLYIDAKDHRNVLIDGRIDLVALVEAIKAVPPAKDDRHVERLNNGRELMTPHCECGKPAGSCDHPVCTFGIINAARDANS